ncbi:hypothetical protein [Acanthopleuribacter pedis]|uniref:Uncharacterized protein n=1 Tax=Acanthopleuribacter pedis TaxID=442870 RepID=A0A8J7QS94_9BACT|nr:hypothetical protein [Acanthopleuribacter pedis]MBO1323495.1 hypothetical protein [Acanthopleuribacter pedis]
MKFNPVTSTVVLGMTLNRCYTLKQAAMLGPLNDVERLRRRFFSLSQNHSFDGWLPRTKESPTHYRARMKKELGLLGDFIHIRTSRGENRRPYNAYSGAIYKHALGDNLLHLAALSLCHLIVAGDFRLRGPYLTSKNEHDEIIDFFSYILPEDKAMIFTSDWADLLPLCGFLSALNWGCGKPSLLPSEPAPEILRTIFFYRAVRPRLPLPETEEITTQFELVGPQVALIPFESPQRSETPKKPPFCLYIYGWLLGAAAACILGLLLRPSPPEDLPYPEVIMPLDAGFPPLNTDNRFEDQNVKELLPRVIAPVPTPVINDYGSIGRVGESPGTSSGMGKSGSDD